jgi:hypothetical protein
MKVALTEAVPARRQIPMCDQEKNPIVAAQQAPAGLVADLLMTAERELAAFYTAVVRRYGPEEAMRAAYDWIKEMGTMNKLVTATSRISTRTILLAEATDGFAPRPEVAGLKQTAVFAGEL